MDTKYLLCGSMILVEHKEIETRTNVYLEELGAALIEEEIKRRKILPRRSCAKSMVTNLKAKDIEVKLISSLRARCYMCPQR